jgi:type IV pilus assembly protein PilF
MTKLTIFIAAILLAVFVQESYTRTVKTDTVEFYLGEGFMLLNTGDVDGAEQRFMKALKKRPTSVDAMHGLGIVYLNKRNYKKCVEYFQKVVKASPISYDAFNYLGIAYTEMGEFDIAKENLLAAANAERYKTPENAYVNLAMLEIRQRRYDAAMRYVEKGMEKNSRFAPLYNLKGVVLENQGKLQEAIAAFEQGITLLKEEDPTFLLNMGRVYMKLDQKDKALDMFERALPKAYNDDMKNQIRQMIKDLEKK